MAAKRILFIEPVPALRQRIAGGLEHLRDRWELSFAGTHAEVGACLLGSWGLPSSIVEAVVWHHAPRLSDPCEFTPLTAVHVANTLAYEREAAQPSPTISQIDSDYMSALGLGDRCDIWRRICVIPAQETTV